MHWIWDNRAWLFSGIGVAGIGLLFSVMLRLLAKTRSRKECAGAIAAARAAAETQAIPDLTSVLAEFGAAPLLQEPDLAKHYLGLRVRLCGQITFAESLGNAVQLILNSRSHLGQYGAVFQLDPRAHSGIGFLKQGTPATVIGDIAGLTPYSATLHNVEFTIDR